MAHWNPLRHLDARERAYLLCAVVGYGAALLGPLALDLYDGGLRWLRLEGAPLKVAGLAFFYGTAFTVALVLALFGVRFALKRAQSKSGRVVRLGIGAAVALAGLGLGAYSSEHIIWTLDVPKPWVIEQEVREQIVPDAQTVWFSQHVSLLMSKCDSWDWSGQDESDDEHPLERDDLSVVWKGMVGRTTVETLVFYRRHGYRDWHLACVEQSRERLRPEELER